MYILYRIGYEPFSGIGYELFLLGLWIDMLNISINEEMVK